MAGRLAVFFFVTEKTYGVIKSFGRSKAGDAVELLDHENALGREVLLLNLGHVGAVGANADLPVGLAAVIFVILTFAKIGRFEAGAHAHAISGVGPIGGKIAHLHRGIAGWGTGLGALGRRRWGRLRRLGLLGRGGRTGGGVFRFVSGEFRGFIRAIF